MKHRFRAILLLIVFSLFVASVAAPVRSPTSTVHADTTDPAEKIKNGRDCDGYWFWLPFFGWICGDLN